MMTNIKTKKPLRITVVCSRTTLQSKNKTSREAITPVRYFAFAGHDIKPSKFIPLKVFTFELIRRNETEEQLQACAPAAKSATKHAVKGKSIVLESQVLPELDKSATKPMDFYRMDLMFTTEVMEEAAQYVGSVDPSIAECKDAQKRNIINGLLRLLDPKPKYVLKSLKALVGHRVDEWARDKIVVMILILLLMVNDWKLKLDKIPLKTKKLRVLLGLVGCRIVDEVAVLCRKPRFETRKQLR